MYDDLPVTVTRMELEIVAEVARFDGSEGVAESIDCFLKQLVDEVISCCEPAMPEMVWWGVMYYHWAPPDYRYRRPVITVAISPLHMPRSRADALLSSTY